MFKKIRIVIICEYLMWLPFGSCDFTLKILLIIHNQTHCIVVAQGGVSNRAIHNFSPKNNQKILTKYSKCGH